MAITIYSFNELSFKVKLKVIKDFIPKFNYESLLAKLKEKAEEMYKWEGISPVGDNIVFYIDERGILYLNGYFNFEEFARMIGISSSSALLKVSVSNNYCNLSGDCKTAIFYFINKLQEYFNQLIKPYYDEMNSKNLQYNFKGDQYQTCEKANIYQVDGHILMVKGTLEEAFSLPFSSIVPYTKIESSSKLEEFLNIKIYSSSNEDITSYLLRMDKWIDLCKEASLDIKAPETPSAWGWDKNSRGHNPVLFDKVFSKLFPKYNEWLKTI